MNTEIDGRTGAIGLKEWSATNRALGEGRQIVLLRKGGILDEDGVFQLEYPRFWLQPTYIHQDKQLVKPEHRDLLHSTEQERLPGENRDFIVLRYFAIAEDVFALTSDDEDKLRAAEHIWSTNYLDLRFNYKPDHPLLCVALRVYEVAEPYRLPMQAAWSGCRSWLELGRELSWQGARPVFSDAEFAQRQQTLRSILAL